MAGLALVGSFAVVAALVGDELPRAADAPAPQVKPAGAYEFLLPGLQTSAEAKPKAFLWCHAARLVGVVVPSDVRDPAGGGAANRSLPSALVLRDGRCGADGQLSFGFLVPVKGWVFESAARTPPAERTTWLLHRFEGSLQGGVLKGTLVQVDVNHPGYAFREAKIEGATLPDPQAPFADEAEWLASMTRAFSFGPGEP